MKKFIIVGKGLAAHCLMHQFYRHNINFVCIGEASLSTSSKVAAGIWNPVVFKRMTASWMADVLVPSLESFYSDCEKRLNTTLIHSRQLIKPFTEDQEKVLWQKKAAAGLNAFLDTNIYDPQSEHHALIIKNQYGLVKQAGNLNINAFIDAGEEYFKANIITEVFDYTSLSIHPNHVSYKNIEAENILFCEGYLVKNNPYFKWIPLVPAKGETLIIRGLGLGLKDFIFNKDGFVMDLGNDHYKVGATYEWKELNDKTSTKGLKSLEDKIQRISQAPYQIVKQEAGVRPSSLDRRPIIGKHPKYPHLHIFNGLGAKGVMLAPFFTENFVHFYLQKTGLHPEVDVKRFYQLYEPSA